MITFQSCEASDMILVLKLDIKPSVLLTQYEQNKVYTTQSGGRLLHLLVATDLVI